MNEQAAYHRIARDKLIEHEVGHLAALLMLGMSAREVRVWEEPGTIHGEVTPAGAEEVRDLMKAILAGPISEGTRPPVWPLVKGVSVDEDHLVVLSEYLSLAPKEYGELVTETYYLIAEPRFAALSLVFITLFESLPSGFKGNVIDRLLGNEKIANYVEKRRAA